MSRENSAKAQGSESRDHFLSLWTGVIAAESISQNGKKNGQVPALTDGNVSLPAHCHAAWAEAHDACDQKRQLNDIARPNSVIILFKLPSDSRVVVAMSSVIRQI